MNMLPIEFPVQVLEHAQILRLVAVDQVPSGLSNLPAPTVPQFPEVSSSDFDISHLDSL
jgi:hypothetical protein